MSGNKITEDNITCSYCTNTPCQCLAFEDIAKNCPHRFETSDGRFVPLVYMACDLSEFGCGPNGRKKECYENICGFWYWKNK